MRWLLLHAVAAMGDKPGSAGVGPTLAGLALRLRRVGFENHILQWIKSLYYARQPSRVIQAVCISSWLYSQWTRCNIKTKFHALSLVQAYPHRPVGLLMLVVRV